MSHDAPEIAHGALTVVHSFGTTDLNIVNNCHSKIIKKILWIVMFYLIEHKFRLMQNNYSHWNLRNFNNNKKIIPVFILLYYTIEWLRFKIDNTKYSEWMIFNFIFVFFFWANDLIIHFYTNYFNFETFIPYTYVQQNIIFHKFKFNYIIFCNNFRL